MRQAATQATPIPAVPTAYAWGREPGIGQEIGFRWLPLHRKRKGGAPKRPQTLRELNAWFEANQEMVMADAERAWAEATRPR